MPRQATVSWPEVESEVYQPGSGLVLGVGLFFLVSGAAGLLATATMQLAPGVQTWIYLAAIAIWVLLGSIPVVASIRRIAFPTCVRHAARDVLPDVPAEPVIQEGSVILGRLPHELVEDDQGWQFRPARGVQRFDQCFLFGFGVPFLIFFAGLASWVFHEQGHFAGWVAAIVGGIAVTTVCGGTVLLLIGMLMRASYRRLSLLTIPRDRGDLQLDLPEVPNLADGDLASGLQWAFVGGSSRRRTAIPRELVCAVQLSPWKFVLSSDSTWAVQGLLVLRSPEAACLRLPIMLTGDSAGAARLMQRLAAALEVPYLFAADAAGWQAEEARAAKRPSLRVGGIQS